MRNDNDERITTPQHTDRRYFLYREREGGGGGGREGEKKKKKKREIRGRKLQTEIERKS